MNQHNSPTLEDTAQQPPLIRNVCILAHVDHGKTTLSDSLLTSNGIISARSAGKIRFLDSREDEQARLITMKSSCISLLYKYTHNIYTTNSSHIPEEVHTINLIDSPGHVDFSSEVSTAVRLCDGALLLIDAVEGVCPQTRAVLRQAWHERVQVILVINKMDRLICNLYLTTQEAYQRLNNIIEQVNAIVNQFKDEEMQDAGHLDNSLDESSQPNSNFFEWSMDSTQDDDLEYSPSKGNVFFCSSIHGWCFNIPMMCPWIAKKLGLSLSLLPYLVKSLWGNFYYNPKLKRITSKKPSDNAKPLFIQFILDSIWRLYDSALINFDVASLKKIIKVLNLDKKIDDKFITSDVEFIKIIFSNWLPLGDTVLRAIIEYLPNPVKSALWRIPRICPHLNQTDDLTLTELRNDLEMCKPEGEVIIYIAKFLSADLKFLRLTSDKLHGTEDTSDFVGFARIFSGILTPNTQLHVCGTASSTKTSTREELVNTSKALVTAERIFIPMGRELNEITQAHAGSVVCISFTKVSHELNSLDRCVTLSTHPSLPPFYNPYTQISTAIVRVSIEPEKMRDMNKFLYGLNLLYKADPSIQIDVQSNGEHIIGCCGEVHLERCINDLQELYCRIPLKVSLPLVAIREGLSMQEIRTDSPPYDFPLTSSLNLNNVNQATQTKTHTSTKRPHFPPWTVHTPTINTQRYTSIDYIEAHNTYAVKTWTSNLEVGLSISARPMPPKLLEWLDQNVVEIKSILHHNMLSNRFPPSDQTSPQNQRLCSSVDTLEYEFDFLMNLTNEEDEINVCERLNIEQFNFSNNAHTTSMGRLWELCFDNDSRNVLLRSNTLKLVGLSDTHEEYFKEDVFDWSIKNSHQIEDNTNSTKSNLRSTHNNELPLLYDVQKWIPSIISGFHLASQSGPLAEEPIRGIIFILDSIELRELHNYSTTNTSKQTVQNENINEDTVLSKSEKAHTSISGYSQPFGPFSGQIISSVRECCRQAVLKRGLTRIFEAMLRLELHCEQSVLGRTQRVLAQRRAQIISEDMRDGTSVFMIEAYIPVAESFGIAQSLRSKASGHVTLHLQFSHWAISEEDPFPEASMTDEEIEDNGDTAPPINSARKIITEIRKRKGLITEEKVISVAEKQRTLSKTK